MQYLRSIYCTIIGTEEPTDTSTLLWADTVNGLKYYDGSAWVNVPMVTS